MAIERKVDLHTYLGYIQRKELVDVNPSYVSAPGSHEACADRPQSL